MISTEHILPTLVDVFPAFAPDSESVDLPYVILGEFASFVIDIYEAGDETELRKAVELIEFLHTDGDSFVREAATIGLLEGIQNSWLTRGAIPQGFEDSLLPESRVWWDSLNGFWSRIIPHVGADLQK
ncbi:MAG: hypothetical protein V4584_16575 [Verrucomicrobiota bacterium]